MKIKRYSIIGVLLLGLGYLWWVTGLIYGGGSIAEYSWGDFLTLEQTASSEQVTVATSTRILLTGDVFLGRDVEDKVRLYGTHYSLALFKTKLFTTADAIVINFEAPVPEQHTKTPHFGMHFSVATSAVAALAKVGVTHASLANNHTGDHGKQGLQHTREQFQSYNMVPMGSPWTLSTTSVALIDTVQGPLALLSINTVNGLPPVDTLRTLLESLPPTPAGVVAYVHWGDEYVTAANQTQSTFAKELVAAGVDLIIGHHPHVVQTVTVVDGVPVIYSLGNTVFDQYFSAAVQEGMVVALEYTTTKRTAVLHPISSIGSRTRPYLSPAWEKDQFLKALAKLSEVSLEQSIKEGSLSW